MLKELSLFEELKTKLELHFGESELTQNYYLQFTNRKQSLSEDFATLGSDLERLSRKAYPECTHEVRDKIACSQFVAALTDALTDGFIKRTLQVEGITSLRLAIERAKTLKFINQNSFSRKGAEMSRDFRQEGESVRRDNKIEKERKFKRNFRSNKERKTIEC